MANAFANVNGTLTPIPPELREPVLKQVASLHQNDRCPGSGEHRGADGSNPWKPTPDFNCDPSHTLPGD
jgi:hypothetical protein